MFLAYKLIKISFKLLYLTAKTSYLLVTFIIKLLFKAFVFGRNYYLYRNSEFSRDRIQKMICNMTGRQFEIFMAEVFKAVGYGVELTQATNDGGKDIILYRDGKKIFVECKRWSGDWLIGREILQKLAGASLAEKSDKMICITTGNYHRNAIEYAKLIDNLSLWDMQDVMETVDEVPKENIAWIMTKTFTPETKNMFANVAERSENI